MLDWERLRKTIRTMVWFCTKQFLISQKRANQWKISVPSYLSCLHNQLFLLLILLGREGVLSLTSTPALPACSHQISSLLNCPIYTDASTLSFSPAIFYPYGQVTEENKLLSLHQNPSGMYSWHSLSPNSSPPFYLSCSSSSFLSIWSHFFWSKPSSLLLGLIPSICSITQDLGAFHWAAPWRVLLTENFLGNNLPFPSSKRSCQTSQASLQPCDLPMVSDPWSDLAYGGSIKVS